MWLSKVKLKSMSTSSSFTSSSQNIGALSIFFYHRLFIVSFLSHSYRLKFVRVRLHAAEAEPFNQGFACNFEKKMINYQSWESERTGCYHLYNCKGYLSE